MKRRIISILVIVFSLFLVLPEALAESSASKDFNSKTDGAVCADIFQQVCNGQLDYLIENPPYQTTKKPFMVKSSYYYKHEGQTTTFAARVAFTYEGVLEDGNYLFDYAYFFEIVNGKLTAQLDEPKSPIAEEEWIVVNKFTEKDCYNTAKAYFDNQRWKDPSSITIYDYTVSYGVGTYIYLIDYSGKNSFGGNSRELFTIEVDAITNKVISGMSI